MKAQPDTNIANTSDELEIQRMEGEGCRPCNGGGDEPRGLSGQALRAIAEADRLVAQRRITSLPAGQR
jgi:hypothetical protein